MIEHPIKHEPLIFVPFRARGHEAPLHERFCTVLLIRVESEYTIVDYLDDVTEGCGGHDSERGGEGAFAAYCGIIAWLWKTCSLS